MTLQNSEETDSIIDEVVVAVSEIKKIFKCNNFDYIYINTNN